MKRLGCLVLASLLLAGCGSTMPRVVEVPVAVPIPEPPKKTRPPLTISILKPDSPPDVVIRAYASSLEALAGYAKELETILDGYRGAGAK